MAQLENFRLKVFRTVAEHLNLREAAERLFLTQPAITLQIKALEDELARVDFFFTASVWLPRSVRTYETLTGLPSLPTTSKSSGTFGQVPNRLICSFSYPCSRAHRSKGIVASSSTTATASPVFVKSMLFR